MNAGAGGARGGDGPRVVAIGGGHGLAATLQAARHYAGHITAVVSVADDGGSTGRLREALGLPAPGDIRRCLVALADPDGLWSRAFEHRFGAGELAGHPLGNLVIAGLAGATGDFISALDEAGRLLGAAGRVLPATTTPVTLRAETRYGTVEGQLRITTTGHISQLALVPGDADAPPAVLEALAGADQVILGPGSLFSSVLAAAIVPGVRRALEKTPARKVYVANLREQRPEAAGYDVAACVDALTAHGVEVDEVLRDGAGLPRGALRIPCADRDLAWEGRGGHDPHKLARALRDLLG